MVSLFFEILILYLVTFVKVVTKYKHMDLFVFSTMKLWRDFNDIFRKYW